MTVLSASPTAASVPTPLSGVSEALAQAQIAELTRQRDALQAELQEFTYTVSHDLRAPLRHINAFAQIIEEDWPAMPPEVVGHLATIRQSAQLLTRQLEGLTALSRLGQQPLNLGPVALADLVRRGVDALTQSNPQRALVWQVAADLPTVLADANLLHQVLALLLDNACKFTRACHPAQISLTWETLADGHSGSLRVQDNGVGFEPDQASQLFKVFARLHPTREFEGLGLGLVMCRKLLERMGGSISIRAEPGAGCCVTLGLQRPQ